jgi:SAM-dependent methyltransferase
MSTLHKQEASTYTDVWAVSSYSDHSPGEQFASLFIDMAPIDTSRVRGVTILDAGCGSGKGAVALQKLGFSVKMVDITAAGLVPAAKDIPFFEASLWDDLSTKIGYNFGGKVDYVYCCDVMEHIPPQFTMLVARRLLDVARRGVFFSISLVPDNFGIWIGKPLHQSVYPFTVWRDNLDAIGKVIECRDLLDTGLYYVEPR